MYLIAKFEKKVKDLIIIPEDEKSIYNMFQEDINNFWNVHGINFEKREIIKVPFHTFEKVGIEIYKI